MAKLNPQQFTLEAFPEQQSWIGKLFSPLNTLTGDIVRAFRNQLSIEDNLFQEIKEIKFIDRPADYPVRFTPKFSNPPLGLSVIYIYNNTTSAYSDSAPHVEWSYDGQQVVISNVGGLAFNNNYTMRLLIYYG
jgi:hypothetical protein